jgi:hypothetical protein
MEDCVVFGVECGIAGVGLFVWVAIDAVAKTVASRGMEFSFESGTVNGFIVLNANAPKRPRIAQRVTTREVRFILVPGRRGDKTWLSISCIPIDSFALQNPQCASDIYCLCM